MKATSYHIRDETGLKVVGGTRLSIRGGTLDLNGAAAELTDELDVAVLNSGRVSFMRNGQPVWLYLSVDPAETDKGKAALIADSNARAAAERERRALEAAQNVELFRLICDVGAEAAIAHLRSLSILKKAQP